MSIPVNMARCVAPLLAAVLTMTLGVGVAFADDEEPWNDDGISKGIIHDGNEVGVWADGLTSGSSSTAGSNPGSSSGKSQAPQSKSGGNQAGEPSGSESTPAVMRVGQPGEYSYPVLDSAGIRTYQFPGTKLDPAAPATTASAAPAGPSVDEVEAAVARVVASLKVPDPVINFGPEPSVNEWKMLAVGFPFWLWLDDMPPMETSATDGDLTVALQVRYDHVIFSPGDGEQVRCGWMSRYKPLSTVPGSPSPDCGYTYFKKGDYQVTADVYWLVSWQAGGYTGEFYLETSASRDLKIGELRAVVTG